MIVYQLAATGPIAIRSDKIFPTREQALEYEEEFFQRLASITTPSEIIRIKIHILSLELVEPAIIYGMPKALFDVLPLDCQEHIKNECWPAVIRKKVEKLKEAYTCTT